MNTFDAIHQRRSVKAFDPAHRFTAAEERTLLEAAIINLPADYVIGFMIAVGKAAKPAWPKGGQFDLAEVVVQDRLA